MMKIAITQYLKILLCTIPSLWQKHKRGLQTLKTDLRHTLRYRYQWLKHQIQRQHKHRRLQKLPWYLVLGSPQSGKKTFIKNTGLLFARPEYFGEDATNYIQQVPDVEWWFSEQAVLIDCMEDGAEQDEQRWRQLTKLLRRERKNKPFNGVIILFSLPDLLRYRNQDRHNFIHDICQYLRTLHEQFHVKAPVYLIFNQCDLIEGFMSFFNDLSKAELQQVWGMTLPLSQDQDLASIQAFFQQQYAALIQQLRKRVMWALDTERTDRGRELINAFPQQMQLFQRPIEQFLAELLGAMRHPYALQLRGIYFTSGTQDQRMPIDFVTQALSKKFQLVPPQCPHPNHLGECYFMQSIFRKVIYPESHTLGYSQRSQNRRHRAYLLTLGLLPTLLIATTIGMHRGYEENAQNLNAIQADLAEYHANQAHVNLYDPSIQPVMPALSALYNATQQYHRNGQFGINFLYVSGLIENALHHAFERSLHTLLIPRIAAQLQQLLTQNLQNLSILYATLKGYLFFSANQQLSAHNLILAAEQMWGHHFTRGSTAYNQRVDYLHLALQSTVAKLPLQPRLIDQVIARLAHVIPSQRAYGLLVLRAQHIPPLLLSTAIGNRFPHVFTNRLTQGIDGFYTRTGFETIFKPYYRRTATTVSKDNREIGLSNDSDDSQTTHQIRRIIERDYQQRYIAHWQSALDAIQIIHLRTLASMIGLLNQITSRQSAMAKLLQIIHDNTHRIDDDQVHVAQHFSALNRYSQNTGQQTWSKTVETLKSLRNALMQLQQSRHPHAAAFKMALVAIQGTKGPIQELRYHADLTPQPMRQWLQSIARQAWQLILLQAYHYINHAWREHVITAYQDDIRDRYPLLESAQAQVSIDHFNHFFGYSGRLQQFFHHDLKPFINTDTRPWQAYHIHGLSIQLPTDVISVFERAAKIRQQFFSDHANHAKVHFTLQPQLLSNQASSVQIHLGSQRLIYQDGPRTIHNIHWPWGSHGNHSAISIDRFTGHPYTHRMNGPWSLFQLLSLGDLKRINGNGLYQLIFDFNGLRAVYQIIGSSNSKILTLADLHGFSLPLTLKPIFILHTNLRKSS